MADGGIAFIQGAQWMREPVLFEANTVAAWQYIERFALEALFRCLLSFAQRQRQLAMHGSDGERRALKRVTRRELDHHIWTTSEARTGFGGKSHARLMVYSRPAQIAADRGQAKLIHREHLIEKWTLIEYLMENADKLELAVQDEVTARWFRNVTLMCGVMREHHHKLDAAKELLPPDRNRLPLIEKVMKKAWKRYSDNDRFKRNSHKLVFASDCEKTGIVMPPKKLWYGHPTK
jgi:hypothetical protein